MRYSRFVRSLLFCFILIKLHVRSFIRGSSFWYYRKSMADNMAEYHEFMRKFAEYEVFYYLGMKVLSIDEEIENAKAWLASIDEYYQALEDYERQVIYDALNPTYGKAGPIILNACILKIEPIFVKNHPRNLSSKRSHPLFFARVFSRHHERKLGKVA